ncbi:hypothetical protein K491DRAFT_352826 [Lophiostoma macrostomum CBS 122681]|uniref:Uncharacterized protein n=1 Tax=Lophiostoma macrostomum CBS 122681 TaxID=1314788 RepID=A0A6A6TDA5_9PLEO|nr:hypothetical protein K491DRAFT_352826 [Lophiostoma macrostomum CBS 122681]
MLGDAGRCWGRGGEQARVPLSEGPRSAGRRWAETAGCWMGTSNCWGEGPTSCQPPGDSAGIRFQETACDHKIGGARHGGAPMQGTGADGEGRGAFPCSLIRVISSEAPLESCTWLEKRRDDARGIRLWLQDSVTRCIPFCTQHPARRPVCPAATPAHASCLRHPPLTRPASHRSVSVSKSITWQTQTSGSELVVRRAQ